MVTAPGSRVRVVEMYVVLSLITTHKYAPSYGAFPIKAASINVVYIHSYLKMIQKQLSRPS